MTLTWVLVNCNSVAEARTIGRAALKARRCSCIDIIPRIAALYFWPPKADRIEQAKGCILILETLPLHRKPLTHIIRKRHSDTLPFIGTLTIRNVSAAYGTWMRGELRKPRVRRP